MDRQDLESVIVNQRALFKKKKYHIVDRNVDLEWYMKGNEAVVISGIRRCGKSTLMKIISERMGEPWFFIDFDDLRLVDFTKTDFKTMESIAQEMTGTESPLYLLDEVQNVKDWDRWVADLYKKGIKVILTGSNHDLLGPEISSHLTGRNKTLVLYPFSFAEYLCLEDINRKGEITTGDRNDIRSGFSRYMRMGGFPLVLRNDDILLSRQYLDDIIHRDIISKRKLKQVREIKDMIVYILTNAGSIVPYSSLQELTGLKSKSTVARFVDYLISAFLIFPVSRFDYSVKNQAPQKFYSMDPSFLETASFNTSENLGKRLENMVAIELMRRKKDIYFHSVKKECDFVIKEGLRITEAIQVTMTMSDPRVQKREVEGLEEAMRTYSLKEGKILTMDTKKIIDSEAGTIRAIPVWEWLLKI